MKPLDRICAGDRTLVRIVDQAMAEAERRSGAWIACRLGCTACCLGPFPITQLDALRLQRGLEQLWQTDPERAKRVVERARAETARLLPIFAGDPATGVLSEDEQEQERFFERAGDEPCPALDPETGACDLYASRPITCRTFGPAVRVRGEALGHCELCYQGAEPEQIEACEVDFDPDGVEALLLAELESAAGMRGQTIVAFALAHASEEPPR
ncbi:MAG: YkgJ family cysteine cluster protein [Bryobacteraceae bacterium]|nr:YkgJ family cysteine cluster protein [Bryobacteraceae bacterium]